VDNEELLGWNPVTYTSVQFAERSCRSMPTTLSAVAKPDVSPGRSVPNELIISAHCKSKSPLENVTGKS